jgi:hypothetical protein
MLHLCTRNHMHAQRPVQTFLEVFNNITSGLKPSKVWKINPVSMKVCFYLQSASPLFLGVYDSTKRIVRSNTATRAQAIYWANAQCLKILSITQSRTRTIFHSYLKTSFILFRTTTGVLSSFVSFFLHFHKSFPPPSRPSFLKVTVLHYSVFTKSVNNQSSNWLLAG